MLTYGRCDRVHEIAVQFSMSFFLILLDLAYGSFVLGKCARNGGLCFIWVNFSPMQSSYGND